MLDQDIRYVTMRHRLSLLSTEQLQRIIDNQDELVFDEVNYDSKNHKFCPLAVGLNLHNKIQNPSDAVVKKELRKTFKPVNVMQGLKGNFFTENRKEDLLSLCQELLKIKKVK